MASCNNNSTIFHVSTLRSIAVERLEAIYHALIAFHNFASNHKDKQTSVYEYAKMLSSTIKEVDVVRFSQFDCDVRKEGLLLIAALLDSARYANFAEPRLLNFPQHAPFLCSSPNPDPPLLPSAPKKCLHHPLPSSLSPPSHLSPPNAKPKLTARRLFNAPRQVASKTTSSLPPPSFSQRSLPPPSALSSIYCTEPLDISTSEDEEEVKTQSSFKKNRTD